MDPTSDMAQSTSTVKPWKPKSKTAAIARVTYKFLGNLPEIIVAKLELSYHKTGTEGSSDEVWERIYGGRLARLGVAEVVDNEFAAIKNLVAINTKVGHGYVNVIVPTRGLSPERTSNLVRKAVSLKNTTKRIQDQNKPMRCHILDVIDFQDHKTRNLDDPLYSKSLATLLRSRIPMEDVPGMEGRVHSEILSNFPKIGASSTLVDPAVTKRSGGEGSGYEFPIYLRNTITLDINSESRCLHIEFDAVLAAPELKLHEVFKALFADLITKHNISEYLPVIQKTLKGLWVKRAYEGPATKKKSSEEWYRPFPIGAVELSHPSNYAEGQSVSDFFKTSKSVSFHVI